MRILRRDGAALAIFFALTLGLTNPLVLHLANAVEDKQDALLNTWIIAWVGHALITDPLNLFNANIFYPYPNTLAFSETMLPQGILALPFNLAFDNTILGYNLVLLSSFCFAAYAMYLFVFDLTRSRSAAIIAGTIFSFNPYNLGNLAQVQLLSFGWMPLAMLYLKPVLIGISDRQPAESYKQKNPMAQVGLRSCFLFALFFSLQCLSSFYYAFLAGIAVVLNLIVFLAVRRSTRFSFYVPLFKRLAISAAVIAVLVVPFFVPYLAVQRDLGFERQVAESEPFSASLKLYSEVSPQNFLYGNLLAPRQLIFNGGYPLDNLFPGFIALALGIMGILSKNRERWFYLALLTLSFVLSLGPRLYLTPTQPTALTLPYRWLYDWLPFMRALRAPVRLDALVMFALAVLAGIGVTRMHASNGQSLMVNRALSFTYLLIPLIGLEYFALPAANITPIPVGNEIPDYVRWLAKQPPGVVLELPMMASDSTKPLDLTTQYLSTYHWHPTPDGYSGFNPPRRGEVAYEMQFFPSEPAVSLLQALDARYIAIHSTQVSDWKAIQVAIDHVADLQLAQKIGGDYIYRVAPRNPSPHLLEVQLYLPQPAAPSQTYTLFLIAQNHSPNSFAIKPTDLWQVDERWDEQNSQHATAVLPLVTTFVSVVPIRLSAPSREGDSRLELRLTGQGVAGNLSGNVTVKNEEPTHEVVIPVGAALRTPLKSEYVRGDSIAIDLAWLPLNKVDAYYSASVRLVDARGNKIAQQDREPAGRTFLWTPGATIDDHFTLAVPSDASPGEYTVQVLMYQADQGIDALLLDNNFNPQETITLGKFTLK